MTPLRTPIPLALLWLSMAVVYAAPGDPRAQPRNSGGTDWVTAAKPATPSNPPLILSSSAVKDGGDLPTAFTGDGESASPPLSWSNVPKGTQSLALIMHHLDPGGTTKIYWVMHDIAPTLTSVAKNARDFGKMGLSTVHNRVEYAAPHSKGPGAKKYALTLFALSSKPDLKNTSQPVTAEALLAAMKGKILAAADLNVVYTRTGATTGETGRRERPDSPPGPPPSPDSK